MPGRPEKSQARPPHTRPILQMKNPGPSSRILNRIPIIQNQFHRRSLEQRRSPIRRRRREIIIPKAEKPKMSLGRILIFPRPNPLNLPTHRSPGRLKRSLPRPNPSKRSQKKPSRLQRLPRKQFLRKRNLLQRSLLLPRHPLNRSRRSRKKRNPQPLKLLMSSNDRSLPTLRSISTPIGAALVRFCPV